MMDGGDVDVRREFHPADYVIFLGVLLVSLIIGLYYAMTGGKQQTTKEFLMADRKMKTLPVALSILVSFVSGILVLGTPAEMYTRGTQLFMRTIGYGIACFLSSRLFVPLFFSLKVTSSFEYLEKRYDSKVVKLIGTISMLIGNLFYMGLLIYAPATALEAATQFDAWKSVVAIGVIATVYTTLGGLKAVIWTDAFQAIVMVTGLLAIVIKGVMALGGLQKVWNVNKEGGRLIFFNFDPDPTERLSIWSTVIGGAFSTLSIFGIGQTSVQRFCTLPTLTQARRAVYLNIPFLIIVNVFASLAGLVIYAHYAVKQCDPLRSQAISNANQLVPYYVMDVLNYPGLPGAFLATLFSGALSSMSSSLNSAAAVTWQDIVRYFFTKTTEKRKAIITRLLVVFYGILAISMAFTARHLGGHVLWASISFSGATMGPTLGIFLLGALVPFANAKGAIVGCVVSSAFSLWLSIGAFISNPHRSTLPTSVDGCSRFSNHSQVFDGYWSNETTEFAFERYSLSSDVSSLDPLNYAQTTDSLSENHSLFDLSRMYEISFLWYCTIGCLLSIAVGTLVSLLTRSRDAAPTDPRLLIPVLYHLCCCLPKSTRKKLLQNHFGDISLDDETLADKQSSNLDLTGKCELISIVSTVDEKSSTPPANGEKPDSPENNVLVNGQRKHLFDTSMTVGASL